MTILNCGTAIHPEECLCDVNITSPVEVDVEKFMGSEYVEYVLRAFGDDSLEDPGGLLQLMASVAEAKDVVDRRQNPPKGERVVYFLKDQVKAWLRDGESILDAPAQFDTSFRDVVQALTSGKPSACWSWDELRWLEVEGALQDHKTWSDRRMAERLGLQRSAVYRLRGYYFL